MAKGLFITIEGPDGSGKSTQIKILRKFLWRKGYSALLTREPGGTAIGETIRGIILDKNNTEMDAMTEMLLYAAARAQHVAEVIKPALERGETVICDRFVDSSIVYQGYGRNLGECVSIVNQYAVAGCMPDITFLMKLNPSIGKSRIKKVEQDRMELEKIAFHNEVFRGYMELEKLFPERIVGIDASRTISEVSREIRNHIERLLKQS